MPRGETATTIREKLVSVPQQLTSLKSPRGKLVEEKLHEFFKELRYTRYVVFDY
jgi:hypothetical protein